MCVSEERGGGRGGLGVWGCVWGPVNGKISLGKPGNILTPEPAVQTLYLTIHFDHLAE